MSGLVLPSSAAILWFFTVLVLSELVGDGASVFASVELGEECVISLVAWGIRGPISVECSGFTGAGLGNGGVCVIRLAAVAKSSTGG
jgi:hypothetical protein